MSGIKLNLRPDEIRAIEDWRIRREAEIGRPVTFSEALSDLLSAGMLAIIEALKTRNEPRDYEH